MTTLKQSNNYSSDKKCSRAVASTIAENIAILKGETYASGTPNNFVQLQMSDQNETKGRGILSAQSFWGSGQHSALNAFAPMRSDAFGNTIENNKRSGRSPFIQPKLTINAPGDQYEQEADAMADKVMRMPANNLPFSPPSSTITPIQRRCKNCEDDEKLHRKENSAQPIEAGHDVSSYVSSLSSKGSPMPEGAKSFFEPRFGRDFSNVKVHTDGVAAKSAQSVNALAYTTGNNIVFNQNQFAPDTDSGKRLLAHELTHVVQQGEKPSQIQRQEKKPPKTTLYIGMNEVATQEAQAIKGGDQTIKVINNFTGAQDTVRKNGKKFDLSDPKDLEAALKIINISDDKISGLKKIFADTIMGTRDEMYKIVDTFNKAENGQISLERIVLSGHSPGDDMFSDHGESIPFTQFEALKAIFPKASSEIKHLMVSACYAGKIENLSDKFKKMFPELATIWAYSGKSLSGQSSTNAIGRWDRQTAKPDTETISPDKDADGWSTKQGLINIEKLELIKQLKKVTDLEPLFTDYFGGNKADKDAHSGPLFDYYNELQNLVGNTDPPLGASDKSIWNERIVVTLKLRFYENVKKEFVVDHSAKFSKGYTKLKLKVPSYQTLSRKDALNEIDKFNISASGNTDSDVAESVKLLVDFKNLNNNTTQRI